MSPLGRRRRRRAGRTGGGGSAGTDQDAVAAAAGLVDGQEGLVPVGRGVRLWCRVVGAGPDTLLVPCTGNADDLAALADPGRRTIFYDARSRGRSDHVGDPAQLGFAAEVADLETIRQAFRVERFAAFGFSYLAGVVATYGLTHPDRLERMVLAAAIPSHSGTQPRPGREPAPAALAELDQMEAAGLRAKDPAALCRAWRRVYVPLRMGRPEAFDAMHDPCDCANEWPWRMAAAMVFVFAQLGQYDWRPQLRDLAVPALVVHGDADADPIEAAREWVDVLPEARLLELDGVGPLPWVEDPDRFFPVVQRFLAGAPT